MTLFKMICIFNSWIFVVSLCLASDFQWKNVQSDPVPNWHPRQSRANDNYTACPSGWHEMYHGCYYIPPGKMTHDVAQANCKIMGAKLAEPVNAEVDLGIALYVKAALGFDELYWLGINDRQQENKWVYDSSGKEVPYTNWIKLAPNDGTDANCVQVNWGSIKRKWDDVWCMDKIRAVCEFDGITENFAHFMARRMVTRDWRKFIDGSKTLIAFVKKHNPGWKQLSTFNIECLIPTKEYLDLQKVINQDFTKYMAEHMTEDYWRLLWHWILEWESSLIYLNPPAPKPWPQSAFNVPLFHAKLPGDKFTHEEMTKHLLNSREAVIPKYADPNNDCKQ